MKQSRDTAFRPQVMARTRGRKVGKGRKGPDRHEAPRLGDASEAAPLSERAGLQNLPVSSIGPKVLPMVSLCTVTQNRSHLLPLLERCILNQTYPRDRLQWVVVDDSSPDHPVYKPTPGTGLIAKLVHIDQKLVLGRKRNLSHQFCDGEIIVYMDDDEFYPSTRVEHAVESLESSGKEIAGATNLPILFIPERELWMAGPYGENHATANTFAFRRSFLEKTQYNDNATHAEEKEFLRNYSFPMVQLDPKLSIVCFGHSQNTFDKRRLIGNGNNPRMKKLDASTIDAWIDPDLLDRYVQAHGFPPLAAVHPSLPAQKATHSNEKGTLYLICSPEGSGENLLFQVLGKLGALMVIGNDNVEDLFSRQLLKPSRLDLRITAEQASELLRHFGDLLLSRSAQLTPKPCFIVRDPRAAVLLQELALYVDLRLIACLRPISDLVADQDQSVEAMDTNSASQAHRIYGHIFSMLTNSDLPFQLIRYQDLIRDPMSTIAKLGSFCGLTPSEAQIQEACQLLTDLTPAAPQASSTTADFQYQPSVFLT